MASLILRDVKYNHKDCTAEGMDTSLGYTVMTGVPIHQVVNGDELRDELLKRGKLTEIHFTLCMYTSLWDWEWDREEEDAVVNKDAVECTHEWVNVGFSTIQLACKKCDKDAPENIYEHKD